MRDQGKFLRLFGYMFFSVIGFLVALVVIFVLLRLFFGLLSFIPFFSYVYVIFILSVPAAVFVSVYTIFWKRTKTHPSTPVRYISWGLFAILILAWAGIYIYDMVNFFRLKKLDIEYYLSYDTLFLTINVVVIFLTGVMQALTTEKEKDWMEKHREGIDR